MVTPLSGAEYRLLRRPADAAEALGKKIHCPTDVRHAARSPNTMQSRLVRYMEDRTRVLPAMSHDLVAQNKVAKRPRRRTTK